MIESSRAYGRDLVRGIMRYSRMHGPWVFTGRICFMLRERVNQPLRFECVHLYYSLSGVTSFVTEQGRNINEDDVRCQKNK